MRDMGRASACSLRRPNIAALVSLRRPNIATVALMAATTAPRVSPWRVLADGDFGTTLARLPKAPEQPIVASRLPSGRDVYFLSSPALVAEAAVTRTADFRDRQDADAGLPGVVGAVGCGWARKRDPLRFLQTRVALEEVARPAMAAALGQSDALAFCMPTSELIGYSSILIRRALESIIISVPSPPIGRPVVRKGGMMRRVARPLLRHLAALTLLAQQTVALLGRSSFFYLAFLFTSRRRKVERRASSFSSAISAWCDGWMGRASSPSTRLSAAESALWVESEVRRRWEEVQHQPSDETTSDETASDETTTGAPHGADAADADASRSQGRGSAGAVSACTRPRDLLAVLLASTAAAESDSEGEFIEGVASEPGAAGGGGGGGGGGAESDGAENDGAENGGAESGGAESEERVGGERAGSWYRRTCKQEAGSGEGGGCEGGTDSGESGDGGGAGDGVIGGERGGGNGDCGEGGGGGEDSEGDEGGEQGAAAARVVAVRAAAVRAAVQIAASVAEANGEGGARTVGGCIAELRLATSATGLSSKLAFHLRRAGAGSV